MKKAARGGELYRWRYCKWEGARARPGRRWNSIPASLFASLSLCFLFPIKKKQEEEEGAEEVSHRLTGR
jgi:hypothetical protein